MTTSELLSKATPRPWQTEERLPHCWAIFPVGCMPVGFVGPQCGHTDPKDDDPQDVKSAQANAELIARAVNSFEAMLAACKRLTAVHDKSGLYGITGWEDEERAALADIRAALALADGKDGQK